jgi:hypothetical protein
MNPAIVLGTALFCSIVTIYRMIFIIINKGDFYFLLDGLQILNTAFWWSILFYLMH